MGQATYREIGGPGGYLAHEKPFEGNTMWATNDPQKIQHMVPSGRESGSLAAFFCAEAPYLRYVVLSYNTIIAWVTTNGTVFVPDEGYSVTTSRQQNLCRAWLARHTREEVLT